MEMHLVLGGPLASSNPALFTARDIEIVGLFPSYDEALDAWRGASQRMIDDAEMRYMIVPLHRIVAPMLGLELEAA